MAVSFVLDIDDVVAQTTFKIIPNTAFPGELDPLCVLTNLGTPPAPDRFITVGTLAAPNDADSWDLTFHWETVGGPIGGFWGIDAFLDEVGPVIPLIGALVDRRVPGFPQVFPGGAPQKFAINTVIPPSNGTGLVGNVPPGLYRLYTTIRFTDFPGSAVRLAGRGIGPLMEFFLPV